MKLRGNDLKYAQLRTSLILKERLTMNLNDALAIIAGFSTKSTGAFTAANQVSIDGHCVSASLQNVQSNANGKTLPSELVQYIDAICPEEGMTLEGVGHPIELLPPEALSWQPDMYSELTGELANWQDDWFLIAHEGGDPVIVKTSEQGELSPVYSAMQGMGYWDFALVADSIGQYLVCACAIQHALNFPGVSEPLDDDFNLAPAAANWLFPLLRQHAGSHYDEWASVFENYI